MAITVPLPVTPLACSLQDSSEHILEMDTDLINPDHLMRSCKQMNSSSEPEFTHDKHLIKDVPSDLSAPLATLQADPSLFSGPARNSS